MAVSASLADHHRFLQSIRNRTLTSTELDDCLRGELGWLLAGSVFLGLPYPPVRWSTISELP